MRLKQIIFGVFLFFLFYFEPLSIGALKFAHLWKIVLLVLLLYKSELKVRKDSITFFSFFYYVKYLLTTGIFYFGYFADGLLMLVRGISIPIINNYLLTNDPGQGKLLSFLNFISCFVLLSSLPFLLGIIEPISTGYVLEQYGGISNGFVGIFQNPHGAAIIISQSLLIQFFIILKNKRSDIISVLAFIIGFVTLYLTYVRTGYVIFGVGFVIILYLNYGIRRIYKTIPILIIVILVVFYFYSRDDVLQRRILQENIYSTNTEIDINRVSSGRLALSRVNLNNYLESDFIVQLIGMGYKYSTILMKEDIGLELFSHNGFVDALVHNGLIGLFLYLLFLKSIYSTIQKHHQSTYYALAVASFWSFMFFIIVQGGNIFLYELELLLIIGLLRDEELEDEEMKTTKSLSN